MVKQLLLTCLIAASCFGQAFTYQDQPYMAALKQGAPVTNYIPDVTIGLMSEWKCNEGSGQVIHDSRGGHHGSIPDVNMWVPYAGECHPYHSALHFGYDFGEASFCVNCGTNGNLWNFYTHNVWSVSVWAVHTNVSFHTIEGLVSATQQQPVNFTGFTLRYTDSSQNVNLWLYGVDVAVNGPPVSQIQNNIWMLYSVTRSGNIYNFYTNATGCSSKTNTTIPVAITSPRLFLGIDYLPGNGRNWGGRMDDVRIYDGYALTTNDVRILYERAPYCPP